MHTIHLYMALVLAFQTSCAIRTNEMQDGRTTTEYVIGLTDPTSCADDQAISGDVMLLGAWASMTGAGLGFHDSRFVCGRPECQIVIWADDSNLDGLKETIGDLENVCFKS